MKFHIITIFPESFENFVSTSIIGKAIDNKLFDIELYRLSDFSDKNFKHVDDNAYGMHGQVISPEPLSKAINFIQNNIKCKGESMCSPYVVYMSPSGTLLNQQ